VDGTPVADDGTVEFRRHERTSIAYVVQKRQIGETAAVEFLRDGKVQKADLKLARPMEADWLVPADRYDCMPTYYIYGGFVFCPVTVNLLKAWGPNWYNTAPNDLTALLGFNYVTKELNEVVLLLKVLPADVNQGYHSIVNWIVDRVDGKKVRDLKELIRMVETEAQGPFVVFESRNGQQLVLDRDKVTKNAAAILGTYRIPTDRSTDLKPAAADKK